MLWLRLSAAPVIVLALTAATEQRAVLLPTPTKTVDIIDSCNDAPGPLAETYCLGYVAAVYDTMTFAEEVCPPTGVTTEQIVAVARKYFSDHPEKWGAHPAFLLRTAFKSAFPCQAGRNP
jgi:Rap1a immunity proteins